MDAHRSRTTLRGRVAGNLVRNLAWAAAAVASWSVVTGLAGPVPTAQLGDPTADPSTDRVAVLVDRHHCWTGAAPAGREPDRAVVTLPGARPRMAPAATGFGIWLDGDPGVLHAFCP